MSAEKEIGMTDPSTTAEANKLTFGIYPGGAAGTDIGLAEGPPDDPAKIIEALARLQPAGRPFLVRGYTHFTASSMAAGVGTTPHPAAVEQYISDGRKLDLVLCYRYEGDQLDNWRRFVREHVKRYGPLLAKLQITEEPNFLHAPGAADGGFPLVRRALVEGIAVAKEEALRQGCDFQVGFNAVLSFDPNDDFWAEIGVLGAQVFPAALDYVGLDFFPDVFHPVAPDGSLEKLREAVANVLRHFRMVNLAAANIAASVPIHIAENGWPTGPERSYERQAAVLETIIQTVYEQRAAHNLTHYELFALRDADSSNSNLFYQFGLLRDDYTPKPAFEAYRRLIEALSK
jgi:hypothetical protein